MSLFDPAKSVLQQLDLTNLRDRGISVFIKRDDLIDTHVSGNKWRKLKYNIENAIILKKEGIVTLGGAYSNHLLATAAACNRAGLRSIGLVRGEELSADSNDNLKRCADFGMDLQFISREIYAERNEPFRQEYWKELYYDFYYVPEGGANYYGMIGCQELGKELTGFDHVFVAQGTCTTSAGLLLGLPDGTRLHVVPVLKGFDSSNEMRKLLRQVFSDEQIIAEYLERVDVHPDFHFGGYGKWDQELVSFRDGMQNQHDLPLDLVYTAKAFYALMSGIEAGNFDKSRICFIHTGGLMNA